MRVELEAVTARLVSLGLPAFLVSVELPQGAATPAAYYLVEPAGGSRPSDRGLGGATDEWSLLVRVKAVAPTPAAAMTHLSAARSALTPTGRTTPLTVTGRAVWVTFARHEADYPDRDVAPPVHLSVDSYTLTSVPA